MLRHSALNFQLTSRHLVLLLASGLLLTTGCQAMRDRMPAMPRLSDMKLPAPGQLAFWKQDSDAKLPPPPARHFDPAPTSGFGEKQSMVAADDMNRYKAEIDAKLDRAERMTGELAVKEPIRKPYGDNTLASNGSSSKDTASGSATKPVSGKDFLNLAGSTKSATVDQAQNDFNATLASAKTKSQDFAASLNNVTDVKYDAQGNLIKSGSAYKDQAKKSFDAALAKVNGSQSKPMAPVENATAAAGDTLAMARNRFSQALAGINGTAQNVAENAVDSSKSFGGAVKDKIAQTTRDFAAPKSNPYFKPQPPAVSATAKQNKSFAAANSQLNSSFDYPSQPAPAATKPLAPAPTTNSFAARQPAMAPPTTTMPAPGPTTMPATSFGQTRVANVTPYQPPATPARPATSEFMPAPPAIATAPPRAPMTAPANTSVANNIAVPKFNPVRDFAGQIPVSAPEGRLATTSHESEVEVPTQILSNSGSYAPGSINVLK